MTILLISHTSELNGAERSLLELAIGLKLQNIDQLVLCPDAGVLSARLNEEGIPTFIMDLPRPQRNLLKLIRFLVLWLPTMLKLFRVLRNKRIHIVYNNTIDGLYGPFAARLAGVPCIWHVREVKPKRRQLRFVFTWLLQLIPTVTVFNSNATLSAYATHVPERWCVIYNGIALPNVNNLPSKIKHCTSYRVCRTASRD